MAIYEQTLPGHEACFAGQCESEWEDEFSHEFSHEFEDEFEEEQEWGDILGGIAKGIGGLLGEGEGEFSHELSHEYSHEGEEEDEAFFGALANLASKALSSPALQNLARSAARSALQAGMSALGAPANALDTTQELLSEAEFETDSIPELSHEYHEFESEDEFELNPVRRVYIDAMMEHLGHSAAEAGTESEAARHTARMVPLARKAMPAALKASPRAVHAAAKAAPHILRAARGVSQTLRQNPRTAPMMRVMPTVIQRSTNSLARRAAQGHPVTPKHAVRAVAHHSARVIRDPRQAVNIYRKARALDKRFHRPGSPARPGVTGARPHLRRPHLAAGGRYAYPGGRAYRPTYTGRQTGYYGGRPVYRYPGYGPAPGYAAPGAPTYAPPSPGYAPTYGSYAPAGSPGYAPGYAPVAGTIGGRRCRCICY